MDQLPAASNFRLNYSIRINSQNTKKKLFLRGFVEPF